MKNFIRSIPFLNAFVPEIKYEGKGIYAYGKTNLLPNELMKFILDSGIAKRCITKTKSYIAATGFIDENLGKLPVNKKQTADQLLTEQAGYAAYFNGAAFHVARNGGALEIKSIPFQCVRKRLDGNFEVNLTYGQPWYKQNETKLYAAFGGVQEKPADTLTRFKEYNIPPENGEILYCYIPSADNQQYPVPDYYAGIEDIRSAAELAKFDLETIINGFITSGILNIVGDFDNSTRQANGLTEREEFDKELGKFTGKEKDANGLSGRQKLLVMMAGSKDEFAELQPFDSKAIMDASNTKRDIIERIVCRLFGINPVLMGFSDAAILGNQQAMANASNELNKVVDPIQEMLEEAFKLLIPGKDWKISEFTPINFVAPELLANMTQDEIRAKLLGLPPLEHTIPTDQLEIITNLSALNPRLSAAIANNLDVNTLRAMIGLDPVAGGDVKAGAAQAQPTNAN